MALALAGIGITKRRVEKLTGGCNCQKRQESLNTFGQSIFALFARKEAGRVKDST